MHLVHPGVVSAPNASGTDIDTASAAGTSSSGKQVYVDITAGSGCTVMPVLCWCCECALCAKQQQHLSLCTFDAEHLLCSAALAAQLHDSVVQPGCSCDIYIL